MYFQEKFFEGFSYEYLACDVDLEDAPEIVTPPAIEIPNKVVQNRSDKDTGLLMVDRVTNTVTKSIINQIMVLFHKH